MNDQIQEDLDPSMKYHFATHGFFEFANYDDEQQCLNQQPSNQYHHRYYGQKRNLQSNPLNFINSSNSKSHQLQQNEDKTAQLFESQNTMRQMKRHTLQQPKNTLPQYNSIQEISNQKAFQDQNVNNNIKFVEHGIISQGEQEIIPKLTVESNSVTSNIQASDNFSYRNAYQQIDYLLPTEQNIQHVKNNFEFTIDDSQCSTAKGSSSFQERSSSHSSHINDILSGQTQYPDEDEYNTTQETDASIISSSIGQNNPAQMIIQYSNHQILPITPKEFKSINSKLISDSYLKTLEDLILSDNKYDQSKFDIAFQGHLQFFKIAKMMIKFEIKEKLIKIASEKKAEFDVNEEVDKIFKNLNQRSEFYVDYVLPIRAEVTLFHVLYTQHNLQLSQKLNSQIKKEKRGEANQKNAKPKQQCENSYFSTSCKCGKVFYGEKKIGSLSNHVSEQHKDSDWWMYALHVASEIGRKSGFQYSFKKSQQDIEKYIKEEQFIIFHQKVFDYYLKNFDQIQNLLINQ